MSTTTSRQSNTQSDKPASDPKAAAAADVVPTPDDDADPAPDPEPRDADDPAPTEEQKPKIEVFKDDARSRAVQRFRELRDKDNKPEAAEPAPTEPETTDGEDDPPAAAAQETPETATIETRPEKSGERPTTVKVKVDGKEIEMSLDEVVRRAQIGMASDNRLEESKRILKDAQEAAKALRGQAEHQPSGKTTAPTTKPDPSQATDPEHQPEPVDPAKLRERLRPIAERIQVGDADEGADALTDLIEEVVKGMGATKQPAKAELDAAEVDRRVDQRLAHSETQREIKDALGRFADKYPTIVKSPLLADAGRTALSMEIIKDLESAGITKEAIDPLRGNVNALAEAQRQLRSAGHDLRSYDKLLEATGEVMSKEFGIKPAKTEPTTTTPASKTPPRAQADPAQVQERVERKRAAPQQPRTAGVRGQPPAAPRPKTRAEIIAEQRAARGFRVTT